MRVSTIITFECWIKKDKSINLYTGFILRYNKLCFVLGVTSESQKTYFSQRALQESTIKATKRIIGPQKKSVGTTA